MAEDLWQRIVEDRVNRLDLGDVILEVFSLVFLQPSQICSK